MAREEHQRFVSDPLSTRRVITMLWMDGRFVIRLHTCKWEVGIRAKILSIQCNECVPVNVSVSSE